MAKKVKSKKTASLKKVGKNADTPATHGQLDAVRSELKSEITTLSLKMDSGFKQVDSRFKKVDAKFDQVDAKFDQVYAKIQEVLTAVQSVKVLVEDQNSRNLLVMDSLRSVVDVQQDLMDRVQKLEKSAFGVEN